MDDREVEPVLKQVSTEIADFIVGFARLRVQDGIEDADPAGSGTLVTVGSVHGILTAAHVLSNLPDQGVVGIVRSKVDSWFAQRLTIDMEHTENWISQGMNLALKGRT